MKILINDLMQFSDLPDDLKSPSLQDRYPNSGTLTVNFTIPSEYALFDIIDGVLSQPMFNGIDGVLSQPMFEELKPVNLIDDLGNQLVDDLGNNLIVMLPGGYETVNLIDDRGNQLVDDFGNDLIMTDFKGSTTMIDGALSQPLSVLGADEFNCIGVGGTDATEIIINGTIKIDSGFKQFDAGLYEIGEIVKANQITIDHNGTYLGRIAVGMCTNMNISPTREPGLFTNNKRRVSVSGAIIPTAGGYGGRKQEVDFRYKITRDIWEEFERAYVTQIMTGFPFFIDFNSPEWIPIDKFYAYTDLNLIFQSSINDFKYSKRFPFTEAF